MSTRHESIKIKLGLLIACGLAAGALATERYVSLDGTNDTAGGYPDWAGAATGIQYAISACVSGDVVWVSNDTYEVGTTSGYRVNITNAITIRSLNNDPTNTIIKGDAEIRPVYMTDNSTLIGFTVTNGTLSSGNGGGINCQSTNTVISNCVIIGNTTTVGAGGGVIYGSLFNCRLIANTARYGGGARFSTLDTCQIIGNHASDYGGGMHMSSVYSSTLISNTASLGGGAGFGGEMYDCELTANSATTNGGGGGYASVLSNCTLTANTAIGAAASGGGAQQGTLYNCTVISNTADCDGGGVNNANSYNCELIGNSAGRYGGGAKGGWLVNCLVASNYAVTESSAAYQSKLTNCLIIGNYGNIPGVGGNWNLSMLYNCTLSGNKSSGSQSSRFSSFYNCISWGNSHNDTTSSISNYYSCGSNFSGLGCITNDPLFIANGAGYGTNLVPGDYRLQSGSPCINTGTNQDWMIGAQDLDGIG